MNNQYRSETEIFDDITTLTKLPGYAYALAKLSLNNMINYEFIGEKLINIESIYNKKQFLTRMEINTLIGLMVRGSFNISLPENKVVQYYVNCTYSLMDELHNTINLDTFQDIQTNNRNIFLMEECREVILYNSEPAYIFQYRDLVEQLYHADNEWLINNKQFSIVQAKKIVQAMQYLLNNKANEIVNSYKDLEISPENLLSIFKISPDDISSRSKVEKSQVKAFLQAFTLQSKNEEFKSLNNRNVITETPLLTPYDDNDNVLLFNPYGIFAALYESPFYWMLKDKSYKAKFTDNRGKFAEKFSAKRLGDVFGTENVYCNVDIYNEERKSNKCGEIDVLVIFADYLIIVQAKTKKLTLEARGGNEDKLLDDFKKAIQDAYEQGFTCAQEIVNGNFILVDSQNGKKIQRPFKSKEIYIFTVLSEAYPALAYQDDLLLKYEKHKVIYPPFVMDIFFLDVLTEMLSTPLRLLNYVRFRVLLRNKIFINQELTFLAYHLKFNSLPNGFDTVAFGDSFTHDLDNAMSVRRDNLHGERTPQGVLTKFSNTLYGSLITQLEKRTDSKSLEIGFELLTMSENSINTVNLKLEEIMRQSRSDRNLHDFTLSSERAGICFHYKPNSFNKTAKTILHNHCKEQKYKSKANLFFGLLVDLKNNIQFIEVLNDDWVQSNEMDNEIKTPMADKIYASSSNSERKTLKRKTGRNERCLCGSGEKYKYCCGT